MEHPVELEPGLWLGPPYRTAAELPRAIDAVLSLATVPPPPIVRLRSSLWCPVDDRAAPQPQWLDAVTAWIAGCREQGWDVLIHCGAIGTSRRVLVAAAYLMRAKGWDRAVALAWVRRQTGGELVPRLLPILLDYQRYLRRRAA